MILYLVILLVVLVIGVWVFATLTGIRFVPNNRIGF